MMMSDIAMHILDIGMNSISAKAKLIKICLEETLEKKFVFEIVDNGCGMSEEVLKLVVDPFYTSRTTRNIGLGIPFLKAACELCGGAFLIESIEGIGTRIVATFDLRNIDCPPLGNIGEALVNLLSYDESIAYNISYIVNKKIFNFSSEEIVAELDGLSIQEPSIMLWLKEFINENIMSLKEEIK